VTPEPIDPKEVARLLEALPPEQAREIALRVLRRHPARQPRNDTELFDAVLAVIMAAGKQGISRTELLRRFRYVTADRLDETLIALNKKCYIHSMPAPRPKRGRPPLMYVSAWAA
jgi:hypothetical protein